jgi:glycosyltransferase involved in cell wall biosynthesis
VKPQRIRVIYNGVDRERSVEPMPALKQDGEFLIVAAGRVESDKGFDVLVNAAALAAKEIPRLRVVIFGRGDRADPLREQIDSLGLSGRVRLGGFTRNLAAALAQADLAVSSSFREGVSNFILEAWSAGAPVIATAIPGSAEIITDGARGKLVPPGDARSLAKGIVDAYRHPEQRGQWRSEGHRAVEATFNWNRMGELLDSFLAGVIQRRPDQSK